MSDSSDDRRKKILDINQANTDILQRLAGAGVEIDPTGKRAEMFYEFLVQAGVLTQEQIEEFDLAWVEHFNNYLVKLEADLRAAAEKAREQERAARAAARLGVRQAPGGIIVPGHNGRANGSGRRGRG